MKKFLLLFLFSGVDVYSMHPETAYDILITAVALNNLSLSFLGTLHSIKKSQRLEDEAVARDPEYERTCTNLQVSEVAMMGAGFGVMLDKHSPEWRLIGTVVCAIPSVIRNYELHQIKTKINELRANQENENHIRSILLDMLRQRKRLMIVDVSANSGIVRC